jgi:hypothetical protein
MENKNQNQVPEEEIPNMEQFQVDRGPSEDQEQQNQAGNINGDNAEETGYTEEEIEFADGQNTTLDNELGTDDEENENDNKPSD